MQVVALPKLLPVTLSDYSGEKFSDALYLAFCRANPHLRVERTAEGEILILPPAGFESSNRNAKVTSQLDKWAEKDGRGAASVSSSQFMLQDGSALSQAKAKMEYWIGNGAQLAWLIDGDAQTVYVYRKGHTVKTHRGIAKLAGEGPVEGFVLHLSAIWKGVS